LDLVVVVAVLCEKMCFQPLLQEPFGMPLWRQHIGIQLEILFEFGISKNKKIFSPYAGCTYVRLWLGTIPPQWWLYGLHAFEAPI
jgi:hypothetical protein